LAGKAKEGHSKPELHRFLLTFLRDQLVLHHRLVVLDRLSVSGTEEEDEERQTLLRQLFSVLERDLPNQRHALAQHPLVHLLDVRVASLVGFVVVVRQLRVRSEDDDGRAWWMHLSHDVTETGVELTVLLEVCGHPAEGVVLGLVTAVKVSDDDSLLAIERVDFLDGRELLDRIFKLLLSESGKGSWISRWNSDSKSICDLFDTGNEHTKCIS
jgi:hypothetical protein